MAEQSQAGCTLAHEQSGAGLERNHQQEKEITNLGCSPHNSYSPLISPSQVPCPNLLSLTSASCPLTTEKGLKWYIPETQSCV